MYPEEEKNNSPKPICKICGKELVEVTISTTTYHPRTYGGMGGTAKVLKCPDCGLLYAPPG